MAQTHTGISRRRIVQGAAWATPAILIATAAPALAASMPAANPSLVVGNRAPGFKRLDYDLTLTLDGPLEGGFTIVATSTHAIVSSSTTSPGFTAAGPVFTHAWAAPAGPLALSVTLRFGSNDTGHMRTTFTLFDRHGSALAVVGPL